MGLADMRTMMEIKERGEVISLFIKRIRRDFARPYFGAVPTIREPIIFFDTVPT